MSTQIQRRRGTTAEHSTFTGVEGELTVDTTKDTAVVHDGTTVGGHPLQKQYPPLGSAAAPTYTFTGDTNTGIYSPGADQVAISTGGTGRLFVDANGFVGIGAVNTGSTGAQLSTTTTNSTARLIVESTNAAGYPGLRVANGTGNWEMQVDGANQGLRWLDDGSERLRIDSSGRLGIGTSSPSYLLHVSGNSAQIGLTDTAVTNATWRLLASTGGTTKLFRIYDSSNAADRLVINSSGLVGIGTSSPSYKLHVSGTGTVSSRTFATDATGDASFFVQNDASVLCGPLVYGSAKPAYGALASNETAFYSNRTTTLMADGASGVIKFATGGTTERARIDSAGRLGIGTSSPGTLLELAGNGTAIVRTTNNNPGIGENALIGGYEFYKADASGSGAGVVGAVRMRSADSVGSSAYMTFSTALGGTANDVERVRITSTGRVGIGTTSPSTILDLTGNGNPTITFNDSSDGRSASINGDAGNLILTSDTAASRNVVFRTISGSESARIDSSGRLLIGTSTSATTGNAQYSKIQIRGNTFGANEWASLALMRDGVPTSGNFLGGITFSDSTGAEYGYIVCAADGTTGSNDYPGRLVFSTTADGASSPTERMRVHSNGAINFGSGIAIGGSTSTNRGAVIFIDNAVITSGAGNSTLKYSTSSGIVTYDTSSRLVKENIADCPYGIDALKQLQPRKYFRTDDQKEEIGFIADEMAQVMPEFVPIGSKSIITRNDEDVEQIPLGVNYEKLTAVLTKALQEAIAKIETLEGMVAVNNITIDEQQHQLSTLAARLTALESA
jgi:hypothetical protein